MASSPTQVKDHSVSPERWQKIKEIFDAAIKRAPVEQPGFLAQVCREDDSLRQEVEILIASHVNGASFLETPAAAAVARLIVAEHRFAPGKQIGHYEIVDALGAGGMGEVYRARDTKLGREVAIKVLPRLSAADPERVARFKQEAFTASALNHPNILTVYEFGEIDSQRFIVTEYVDGVTLRHRVTHSRVMVRDALDIASQLVSAVAAAHKAGVIHRDLKPENIMIRGDDGIVKVLDFGLAKATEKSSAQLTAEDLESVTRAKINTSPGVVMGTATYMSPEQARGQAVDERTDIWSLGVVLYEMVAGRLPFDGQTTSDVVSMILQKEPPALTRLSNEADERLDEIVAKTLAKDREERYQVAKDLLIDLKRLKQHLDFAAEIHRTAAPELESASETSQTSGLTSAAQTEAVSEAIPTKASSAEYIVTEIKRHGRGIAVAAVILIVMAIILATVSYWRLSSTGSPPLTDKDTIVLADFVNTTGDQVFDGTLKQAAAVQLGQSPFFNILSDDRVRDVLRFMGRSPDEKITRDVAREICQRQGLKVLLAGSISGLGIHYVLTLEAINAQTGDVVAREQIEAESKEQVLKRLGEAATNLREKLGESLASIKKFDAPLEQATTPSLEALKAYSLGRELSLKGRSGEAIPLYKRATELDPNFALAYSSLAIAYSGATLEDLAVEAAQKAFALRDRTSAYEKLKITADYYYIATGEIEKSVEALQSLTLMYPRDYQAISNLAAAHVAIGHYERAIEEYQEAIRLNPDVPGFYRSLGLALRCSNRFDEAKQVYGQAQARGLDLVSYHVDLYSIAFIQEDMSAMQRQVEWMQTKNNEVELFAMVGGVKWFSGQAVKGRESWNHVVDIRISQNRKELAADMIASIAWRGAVFGNCRQAREDMARASSFPTNFHSLLRFGITHALCGEVHRAESLADEYARRYPKDTFVNSLEVPILRAAIEIRRNHPSQAIELLKPAIRYEMAGTGYSVPYWPAYLRGQAYLALRRGAEAAAEFQKILDHRGITPHGVLYPLAYVGLARASVLTGNTEKARQNYQHFFELWKDADPDIPILIEAKKEYERLK